MTVTITITCDNAAFEDYPGEEIARILRVLAQDAENVPDMPRADWDGYKVRDINGNTVGRVTVTD